jgi:hypothetical protein
MLYVFLYFKLRNFVISQFGIRNLPLPFNTGTYRPLPSITGPFTVTVHDRTVKVHSITFTVYSITMTIQNITETIHEHLIELGIF